MRLCMSGEASNVIICGFVNVSEKIVFTRCTVLVLSYVAA